MFFDLSKIEYIDIHSHLNFKDYKEDIDNVFFRIKENKIATICIGTDLQESREVKRIAEENENIFYSIGLHPHDNLEEMDFAFHNQEEYFPKLRDIAYSEKCVAVGECGLDYFYIYREKDNIKILKDLNNENILREIQLEKEKQKEVFKKHIELAKNLNLPLMLHIRPSEFNGNKEDAYLDAINILKEYKNIKGNFHFFVGTENILNKILNDLTDFTFSIPAVCTFTNEYDEMIKKIPINKIHIETDSPFVIPKNRRKDSKNNEPFFVIDVFEKICEIKNIENKEKFKDILKENFKKMYLK